MKRLFAAALAALVLPAATLGSAVPARAAPAAAVSWEAWQGFADAFVQDDGRVVDWTADARTVSEGQGYALFFALVANDRPRFEKILGWTRSNLAQDDLGKHLPAWLWGTDNELRWRVLDANSATDADLWLAYDLLEAGRLWKIGDYSTLGRAILAQVAASDIKRVDRKTFLLPGPFGFEAPEGLRLNLSYLPPFQLAYFAAIDRNGPWQAVLDTTEGLLPNVAPSGAIPDWVMLTPEGPRKDVQSDGRASYDAIRIYLWAGISAPDAPSTLRWRQALAPFADFVRKAGRLPEIWYPDGRAPQGLASAGLEAAMLPFYATLPAADLLESAQQRLAAATIVGLVDEPARYYQQALTLFGQGWIEQRYRFERDGKLRPQWNV